MALEIESLLHVSLALLKCHRICESVEVNAARCLTTATIVASTSTSTATTTATTIALPYLRSFDEWIVKVALACWLSRWASGRPHVAKFRRISYDVI